MKKIRKLFITLAIFTMCMTTFMADETDGNEEAKTEQVSKTIGFELSKDYEGCSFTITTEKNGNFEVKMWLSNQEDHPYMENIEEGNECIINIEDAKKGRWNITVTALIKSDEQEEKTQQQENSDEEIKELQSPDECIGQIKVSAKAIDKTAFAVGNVQVARDIVGLKYYFVDDAIVVDWTDNSCGNVNVAIIDTKTSQILDKQTIKGKHYEYELPALVDEITIDVVPSTSAGIVGANNQYTVPVDNNPDAKIIFENLQYTNKNSISFEAQLNDTYSLIMMSNGAETQRTGMLSAGSYTEEIPLSEGNNDLLVYVVDGNGNMRSTTYSVILDSIKPALTLNMEYDGAKTYNDVCYIEGTIKDYDTFTINEVVPVVSGDGSFKAEYRLNDGNNVLNIRATDIAGNETLYVANIEKVVKEPIDVNKIILIAGGIVLAVVVIILFIRKKKNDDGSPKENKKDEMPRKENMKKNDGEKRNLFAFMKNLTSWQRNLIETGVIIIVAYIIFSMILIPGKIPSGSMEPTLNVGDIAVANGLAYLTKDPQRGDIVIFKADATGEDVLIKRVIGMPGDSLMFVDGYLYINGELVYEEYLPEDMETNSFKDFEVPEGCYFVMGDNRTSSYDSRSWENPYISKENIKGKMITDIPVSRLIKAIRSLFA